MKPFVFNGDKLQIFEQEDRLVFNFHTDKGIFGFAVGRDSLTPETLAAASRQLVKLIKSKEE
jgi:hypothetical protein